MYNDLDERQRAEKVVEDFYVVNRMVYHHQTKGWVFVTGFIIMVVGIVITNFLTTLNLYVKLRWMPIIVAMIAMGVGFMMQRRAMRRYHANDTVKVRNLLEEISTAQVSGADQVSFTWLIKKLDEDNGEQVENALHDVLKSPVLANLVFIKDLKDKHLRR